MPLPQSTVDRLRLGASLGSTTIGALAAAKVGWATGPWAPVVIGAGAGIGALVGAFGPGSKGPLMETATEVVNFYEAEMRANVADFTAGRISQRDALTVFDALWGEMVGYLQQIPEGVGETSISERSEGGQFDYFAMYRAPIADAQEWNRDVLNPDTPVQQEYGAAGMTGTIEVSPDGVVKWSADGNARVYVSNPDGSEPTLAWEGQSGEVQPDWLGQGANYLFTLREAPYGVEGAAIASARFDFTQGTPRVTAEQLGGDPLAAAGGSSRLLLYAALGVAAIYFGRKLLR